MEWENVKNNITSITEKEKDQISIKALVDEVKDLQKLCKEAHDIMEFHSMRCPLDINNNYSGSEEHLATYRRVRRDLRNVADYNRIGEF